MDKIVQSYMANPVLPHISEAEQARLYRKLDDYNRDRASYKEAGAYLVVLPRPQHPNYSLWIYSPLPERQSIFYICELDADVLKALRMASTLTFYSNRRLFLVEYNAKRMQGKGDDLVSFGKYRGYFLYEVLHVDPAYLTWIAFKFQPRIPKQERFMLIAKIYYSVHTDFQRLKLNRRSPGQFLGKEGEKVADLTLTVTGVRVEDNPYRTQIRNGVECFFVRQLLRLKDAAGNMVNITVNAREASHASGCLPAMERAYRPGDIIQIASARVARTYVSNGVHCTRLTHVKFK